MSVYFIILTKKTLLYNKALNYKKIILQKHCIVFSSIKPPITLIIALQILGILSNNFWKKKKNNRKKKKGRWEILPRIL